MTFQLSAHSPKSNPRGFYSNTIFLLHSKCPFGGDTGAKGKKPGEADNNGSENSEDEESLSEPESDVELDMEGECAGWQEVAEKFAESHGLLRGHYTCLCICVYVPFR